MENSRVPPLHPETSENSGAKSAMWEKFQALQKKRLEVKSKSDSNNMKEENNRKSTQNAFSETSDGTHVQETATASTSSHRKRKSGDSSNIPRDSEDTIRGNDQEGWDNIKSYIDVNSHLKGIDKGRYAAKTKLEMEVDEAVARGDLEAAEALSDQLSTRDFGSKIAEAIDASRYDKDKQVQDAQLKAKRRKKLPWGFNHKERWETKGNM